MDPGSLDRLYQLARWRTEQHGDPLLRLAYWSKFLEEYLASGISAPIYVSDSLHGLCEALRRENLEALDPLFAQKLRDLASDPRLRDGSDRPTFVDSVARLQRAPAFWATESPSGQQEIVAPVVLVLEGGRFADLLPRVGLPTKLRIRAYSSYGGAGQIFWSNRLVPDDAIQKTAHIALSAAVTTLGGKKPGLRYSIEVEEQRASLAGGSLGLAMALIFYAYEASERNVESRIPRLDTAYIGAIDAAGRVQPVAHDSLGSKLRAAAAVGLKRVVLPEANLSHARDELASFQRTLPEYPVPQLVAVQDLADLSATADVATLPRSHIRALVRRERRPPLWAAAILAALLVLGAWILAPLLIPTLWSADRVRLDFSHHSPVRVVARLAGFPFSQKTWKSDTEITFAELVQFTRTAPPALLIGTGDLGPHPAQIELFDVRGTHRLWSRDYSRRAPLPEEIYRTNVIRIDEALLFTDLDGDGALDIIVTAHAVPLSPSFVIWLDRDGNERGFYAHRGYLFFPAAADLDADGSPEVYVRGTSNSDDAPYSQRATLIALDADHFAGWPGDGPFRGSGPTPHDSSIARIIFPPIEDHCVVTESPGYLVKAMRIRDDNHSPIITIELGTENGPGSIVVTLDRHLEPIGVIADDALRAYAQSMVKSGGIEEDFTRSDRLAKYVEEIYRRR